MSSPINLVVGHNVRRLRDDMGLSALEVSEGLAARGIGVGRSSLSELETGKRPVSVEELWGLSLVLGVSPVLLLMPQELEPVGVGDGLVRARRYVAALVDPDGESAPPEVRRDRVETVGERLLALLGRRVVAGDVARHVYDDEG